MATHPEREWSRTSLRFERPTRPVAPPESRRVSFRIYALPSPTCLTVSPALVSMEPTSVDVIEIRPSRSLPPGVLARCHSLEQVFLQPTGTEYAPTTPKENRKSLAN